MKRIVVVVLATTLLMTLAGLPFAAHASTGYITINAKSGSVEGQQVAAGGNINLYFGSVTWENPQVYLMMSTDNFHQVSAYDSQYTAVFSVLAINSLTGTTTYTYEGGTWTVGQEWINGSTAKTRAMGNYWIKAFDGLTNSVAHTDTYIQITPSVFVSPTSNAPNTPITISGFGFPSLSEVSLSYFNPVTMARVSIVNMVGTDPSGMFTYSYNAPDLKQALAAGANAIVTNTIIFSATSTTQTRYDTVIGFSQSARGLLQVKRAPLTGYAASEQLPGTGNMFGNLTDFTLTGSLPVTNIIVGSDIIIAGNRFFPGSATLKWDNSAVVSTPIVDATGFFNATVTVPTTPIGLHNVTMVDANGQRFIIFLTVVPKITLSPTSGPVGTTVTVTGYGFPAPWGTTKVSAALAWPGQPGYIASALTDSAGEWTATFAVPQSAPGIVALTAYSNVTGSYVQTATAAFTVTTPPPDTTPPTGSIIINGGAATTSSTSVTLTLFATDPESGVTQMRFSNDGSSWSSWEAYAASKSWSLASGDGQKTVYAQFKNGVGLDSASYSDSITLDATPPAGSVQINGGATYSNTTAVTLSLLATDSGSGVSQMCFQNEGGVWSSWEPYAASKSWTLNSGDGAKTVYVQFKDNAGLTVTAYDLIVLDMTLPVANAGSNQNSQVGQSVTFNGAGSTDNNGIASYLWNFGDGGTGSGVSPSHTYTSTGTFTVSLMVTDVAGNSAASSSTVSVEVVVPEFSSSLILILLMMTASALALLSKGKLAVKSKK